LTSEAKALTDFRAFFAALKRCATQNLVHTQTCSAQSCATQNLAPPETLPFRSHAGKEGTNPGRYFPISGLSYRTA
jgi:hypothetical protein